MKINRIGFGGWQLGNPLWGRMTYDEGIELVSEAFNRGINFYDTAPGYGNGNSERIIGAALQNVREQVFINSKIGHLADGSSNFSVDSLESQINESLERLNTTYLDSALLHNPSIDILKNETKHFTKLDELKDKGLIHHYGVSIDTLYELKQVLENTNVNIIELLFNVFFQSPKALFDQIKERNIKLIVKVPLDSGWLTGKYNENSVFRGIRDRWSKSEIKRRSELINKMKDITNESDLTLISLAFILKFDAVTAIIPGVRNTDMLMQNLKALSYELSDEIFDKLQTLYELHIEDDPLKW